MTKMTVLDSTNTYDYTIKLEDNNDYSLDPNQFPGLPPVNLTVPDVRGASGATGPYYDTIVEHPDNNETVVGGKVVARDYRLIFKDTNDYTGDPNGFAGLPDFTTENLTGPDGPEGGPMGATGATGPYYDTIDFDESGKLLIVKANIILLLQNTVVVHRLTQQMC